jgi:hypothetical protein
MDADELRKQYINAVSRVFSPMSNTDRGLTELNAFFDTTLDGDLNLQAKYTRTRADIGDVFMSQEKVLARLDVLAEEALEQYQRRTAERVA